MGDAVNHPSHYTQGGVECIEITGEMDFCRGNAVKYLWRFKDKTNPQEDLKKALWYLRKYQEYRFKRVSRKIRNKYKQLNVHDVLVDIHGNEDIPRIIDIIITCYGDTGLEAAVMELDLVIRKLNKV